MNINRLARLWGRSNILENMLYMITNSNPSKEKNYLPGL